MDGEDHTRVSLRAYFELWIKEHDRGHEWLEDRRKELKSDIDRMGDLARVVDQRYRESQNEWKQTLAEKEEKFATKEEVKALGAIVNVINQEQSKGAGRAQGQMLMLSLLPTLVSVAALIYAVTH